MTSANKCLGSGASPIFPKSPIQSKFSILQIPKSPIPIQFKFPIPQIIKLALQKLSKLYQDSPRTVNVLMLHTGGFTTFCKVSLQCAQPYIEQNLTLLPHSLNTYFKRIPNPSPIFPNPQFNPSSRFPKSPIPIQFKFPIPQISSLALQKPSNAYGIYPP